MTPYPPSIGIIGGGLAGLTLAALLGTEGFEPFCIEAQTPAHIHDGRTTAVSAGSRRVLERAGVWQALQGDAAAITRIDILDGRDSHRLVFDAAEMEADAFGWVVDNADLRRALCARVAALPGVTHLTGARVAQIALNDEAARVTLEDGRCMDFALLAGADGRQSLLREAMRIGTWGRDYNQSALVCLMTHDRPHHGVAVEHFRSSGPFALLPYTDTREGAHRSALVWSVGTRDAKEWVDAPAPVFEAAVMERAGGRLGALRLAGKREAWPLSLVKSYRYTDRRALLCAEAAHGMHPIAGQGLNMSLRDLDTLADLLIDARAHGRDYGDQALLRAYQRARRPDNLAMSLATDTLTLLFSTDFLPLISLRRAGLRIVAKLPFAKRFFMREAMGR